MYRWNAPCTRFLLPPGAEIADPSFRIRQHGRLAGRATNRRSLAMSSRLDKFGTEQWEAKASKAGFHPEQLARLCQVSLRQLERHFLLAYQLTPKVWLAQYRLHEGRRLVLEGQLSVKAIAFQLNFKHPSSFSRAFKKFYGVNPTKFSSRPNP
jgi:AraC-like DNA-binding protein